jgi:hypothetical protein
LLSFSVIGEYLSPDTALLQAQSNVHAEVNNHRPSEKVIGALKPELLAIVEAKL